MAGKIVWTTLARFFVVEPRSMMLKTVMAKRRITMATNPSDRRMPIFI